jgi:hypothetical protein
MLAKVTDVPVKKAKLMEVVEKRHPWLRLHRTSEGSEALLTRVATVDIRANDVPAIE